MSTQDSEPRLDPRFRDPVLMDETSSGSPMWGWIAGIAGLILVVFVLIGGWNGTDNSKKSAAPPLDVGTCAMTEVGDQDGSRVTLDCASGKKITFLRKK